MHARSVDLGRSRLTLVEVVPGDAGEGDRLRKEGARLAPRTVAVDLDQATLLDLRRGKKGDLAPWHQLSFVSHLLRVGRTEPASRVYKEAIDLALHRSAPVVPLLPPDNLGAIARWRAKRELATETIPGASAQDLAIAFRKRLEAMPSLAPILAKEEETMAERLLSLTVREELPNVVAVIAYPRSARVARLLVERAEKEIGRKIVQGYR